MAVEPMTGVDYARELAHEKERRVEAEQELELALARCEALEREIRQLEARDG